MSARNLGTFSGPGRRAAALSAVALACTLGGLSACSAGSNETPSTTATSTAIATPGGSPSGSGTGSATDSGSAGSPASAPPTAVPSPSAGSAEPAADEVLKISVQGRTVTPAPGRKTVSVGDRVQLVVTTDTANRVHIHGVEIEKELQPGVPLTVDFTIKDPGVYAVELHDPELLLVQLVVR
jgi:plastocyanin